MSALLLLLVILGVQCQLPPFPLENTVNTAIQYATQQSKSFTPTNLARKDYLNMITGIVQYFYKLQIANGSIIDAYAKEEIQYATPCYSHAAATLIANNITTNIPAATLLESAALALDSAIDELYTGTCAQGHCNFYTLPVVFAYNILSPLVTSTRKENWQKQLAALDPSKIYINLSGNWGVVALVGEYVRTKYGLNPNNNLWYETELQTQMQEGVLTANGQYQDHSGENGLNPMPYDHFPRKYYLVMLNEGYNGTYANDLLEYNRRAAWVSLLMQSSRGELPTGGRSSQHQWNEAVSTVTYEIWANLQKKAGNSSYAAMFKRGSRLSLQSLQRWQNPTGELQIVKNHFDPALRWGYESYSYQSQYNLLPASMLSISLLYMDESIPEAATPADVGGFVFYLPEFHKIFANANGLYIELETAADTNYDSTGLTRFHINNNYTNINSLLGPTAGSEMEYGGLAIGPFWQRQGQSIRSLANTSYADVTTINLTYPNTNTFNHIQFHVNYTLPNDKLVVSEEYTLNATTLSVTTQIIDTSTTGFILYGIRFPAFLYDGVHNTTGGIIKTLNSTSATISLSYLTLSTEGTQQITINSPSYSLNVSETPLLTQNTHCRNGVFQTVSASIVPTSSTDKLAPHLSFLVTPS